MIWGVHTILTIPINMGAQERFFNLKIGEVKCTLLKNVELNYLKNTRKKLVNEDCKPTHELWAAYY
jgi:hypothetical protein